MVCVLRSRDERGKDEYWTGERWSPNRLAAEEYGSMRQADNARTNLESDRDVVIVRETGNPRPKASLGDGA
jgi:hypothetical protein